MNKIELVKPSLKYKASFFSALEEYRHWQGYNLLSTENYLNMKEDDFPNLVQSFADAEQGIGLPEGFVPETTLWLIIEEQYAGTVSIRHNIETQILKDWGGHIGYQIRPSFIGKGYAVPMLLKAVEYAATLGIERAAVSCDEHNIPSKKTIEKAVKLCGGEKRENFVKEDGKITNRFWVNTPLYYDKYISNEIPMTLREKDNFVKEAIALRENLYIRNKQG